MASTESEFGLMHMFLDLRLHQLLKLDFLAATAAGVGSGIASYRSPEVLAAAVGPAATLIGLIVGFGIAAAAIQVAFMDQLFLKKLRAIGTDPVRLLTPFLFTAGIGAFAGMSLLGYSVLPASPPRWLASGSGALASFMTVWALASLPYNLASMVALVRLQNDAVDIPDHTDVLPTSTEDGPGSFQTG